MDSLTLPRELFAAVVASLRAALPSEGVGYLAGPAGGDCSHWLPLANALASGTAFLTTPESALAAHKAMRAAGVELLAVVHSHPTGEPTPSTRDRAGNPYGDAVVWLIVGFAGREPVARAWRLTSEGDREFDIVLTS